MLIQNHVAANTIDGVDSIGIHGEALSLNSRDAFDLGDLVQHVGELLGSVVVGSDTNLLHRHATAIIRNDEQREHRFRLKRSSLSFQLSHSLDFVSNRIVLNSSIDSGSQSISNLSGLLTIGTDIQLLTISIGLIHFLAGNLGSDDKVCKSSVFSDNSLTENSTTSGQDLMSLQQGLTILEEVGIVAIHLLEFRISKISDLFGTLIS